MMPCTGWISTLVGSVDEFATPTPLAGGGKRRTAGTGPPASPCESVLTMVRHRHPGRRFVVLPELVAE